MSNTAIAKLLRGKTIARVILNSARSIDGGESVWLAHPVFVFTDNTALSFHIPEVEIGELGVQLRYARGKQ